MKRIILILLIGIVIITGFFYLINRSEVNLNKSGLEDLDLKLRGVVYKIDKVSGFNGSGIANLKIINSNVRNYDPRPTDSYYYCIIKNGEAEIYDSHVRFMSIGDTIEIDTKNKTILYKNMGVYEKGNIFINTDDRFYNYIKEHHQKM